MSLAPLKILACNPFHGGSHQAFLDNWIAHSRHDWTLLTLPARHWKWRMRQAPLGLKQLWEQKNLSRQSFDLLLGTDMLNLAELKGLLPPLAQVPALIYFHENQFTYPNQEQNARDLHFAFTNLLTAFAANAVWFNSDFHREDFLAAAERQIASWPPELPSGLVEEIRRKSEVQPPGIEFPLVDPPQPHSVINQPLHILWAARWEHDKNPTDFFAALERLQQKGIPFQVSVVGQHYAEIPAAFEKAKDRFRNELAHWGHLERHHYQKCLLDADIVISTANHEFFGMAVVEAMAAGCAPILPNRLSYPELVQGDASCLYDGTIEDLVNQLMAAQGRHLSGELGDWQRKARQFARRYAWTERAAEMDNRLLGLRC